MHQQLTHRQFKVKIPSMRIWLDTEFNGFGGDFISAALVAEDGRYWYQAVACPNPIPWVSTNVIPNIQIKTVPITKLKASLRTFLRQFDELIIIADWPDDVAYFCRLLSVEPKSGEVMATMPTPPLTFELKVRLNGSFKSELPHNALSDAIGLMNADLAATWGTKPESTKFSELTEKPIRAVLF